MLGESRLAGRGGLLWVGSLLFSW